MPKIIFNPVHSEELQLLSKSSDFHAELDIRYVNVTGDNLEGNLTCNAGVLINGYDISVEFAAIGAGIDGGTF